jgi:hypothetical protein
MQDPNYTPNYILVKIDRVVIVNILYVENLKIQILIMESKK